MKTSDVCSQVTKVVGNLGIQYLQLISEVGGSLLGLSP